MTKIVNCNKCINFKYGSHSHYCLLGVRLRFVKTDLPGLKDDPGFRRRCDKYEPIKVEDHIAEAGKMIDQQWISIKEKLPINGWYLTFDGDSVDNMLFKDGRWIAKTGRYDKNGVFTRDDMTEYITHWMNLPDKPKEE